MQDNTTIIDMLRSSRGADDILQRLKENSLEARKEKIAEAVASEDWEYGPADLIYTYDHHVLASKDGHLVRAAVSESKEGKVHLTNIELFSTPTPVNDLAFEVMETAKSAVEAILNEDFEKSDEMITSILKSANVRGDLERRLSIELSQRSLSRDPWYTSFYGIKENKEFTRVVNEEETGEVIELVDHLVSVFRTSLSEAVVALKDLESKKIDENTEKFAKDLIEDVKLIINTLQSLNRDDRTELVRVYESIASISDRYLSGLAHLAKKVDSAEPIDMGPKE